MMDRRVQDDGGDDEANLYRPFVPERSIPMTKALQPLKDKIALVVGGSRGIGAGIARRLAEDGAGIALTYAAAADKANELVQQITAGGGRAIAIRRTALMRPTARRSGENHAAVRSPRHPRGQCRRADPRRHTGIPHGSSRPHAGRQCARSGRCHPGCRCPHGARRSRHYHRQQHCRANGFPGSSIYSMTKGAIASLVRGVAIICAARHYGQQRPARPPVTDMTSVPGMAERVKPLIPLGRMGNTARSPPWWLIGRAGIRLCHRCQHDHRRRLRGLTRPGVRDDA